MSLFRACFAEEMMLMFSCSPLQLGTTVIYEGRPVSKWICVGHAGMAKHQYLPRPSQDFCKITIPHSTLTNESDI